MAPLALALRAAHVIRNPSPLLLLAGWASLWLRRSGWRAVGLRRPRSVARTLGLGVLVAAAYQAAELYAILPLLHRLTGEPLRLEPLAGLRHNPAFLAELILLVWITGGLIEELAYRGYLLSRLGDLLGRGRAANLLAVAAVSACFGLAHASQGTAGILDNVLAGALFAVLYLASGRNLWLPIVAHGATDTLGLLLLFFGYSPRWLSP